MEADEREQIDYLDIPETDANFWAHADIHIPIFLLYSKRRVNPEQAEKL